MQLGGMSGKARLARARAQEGRGAAAHHLRGAAAGMSAAFHAPLTGVLFALEEIHKEFTAPLIISVMCSAVVSDFLVSQVLGVSPVVSLSCRGQPSRTWTISSSSPSACSAVCSAPCTTGGCSLRRGLLARIPERLGRPAPGNPLRARGRGGLRVARAHVRRRCDRRAAAQPPRSRRLPRWSRCSWASTSSRPCALGRGAPGGTLFPLVVLGGLVGAATAVVAQGLGLPAAFCPNFVALGVAGALLGRGEGRR